MLVPPSPSTSSGVVFHQVPSMCSNCVAEPGKFEITPSCQAENHRLKLLSALRAHTKVPHKTDLLWETLRPLNRPETARTVLRKQPGPPRHAATACSITARAGRPRKGLLRALRTHTKSTNVESQFTVENDKPTQPPQGARQGLATMLGRIHLARRRL
jgi:hypothetical protein